jgi:beta-fructofuranosidase
MRVTQWRDPFVFTHEGRTMMLVGGKLAEDPVCLIYEAQDAALVRWRYRGVFFRHPNRAYPHLECPNICRLGKKWVLLCAFELRTVEYHVGTIDWNALTFTSEKSGTLDRGSLYATNLLATPDGRTVLFAWIHGFPEGAGWNGCLSLPRELSIDGEDRLVQTPARELESLRGAHVALGPLTMESETRVLEGASGDRLEIALSADVSRARAFVLELSSVAIRYQDGVLDVNGTSVPAATGSLDLRVFLDGAALEVYAQGGSTCVTRVVHGPGRQPRTAIIAVGGPVIVKRLDVWSI